jgi:hypothetical protein
MSPRLIASRPAGPKTGTAGRHPKNSKKNPPASGRRVRVRDALDRNVLQEACAQRPPAWRIRIVRIRMQVQHVAVVVALSSIASGWRV